MGRVLVACMGNVLRRDDGFGVAVAQRLRARLPWPEQVRVVEVGIGGIHLVQELMAGYDVLAIVDAVDRQSPPGTVHILEVQVPDLSQWPREQQEDFLADMHYATPTKAMILAKALQVLPPQVFIVGCQPADAESLEIGLSSPVQQAIEPTVRALVAFLETVVDPP